MADKNRDPHIAALEAVYAALKVLDAGARRKVLSSVFALLDIEGAPPVQELLRQQVPEARPAASPSSKPVSPIELVQAKQPGTNAQRIASFAYYREKYENIPRFAREDLKPYFSKVKQPPASNYDRDFVEAVRKGWIHEDGADSYLTSKGIEAVESGFEGERKYTKSRKSKISSKRRKKRTSPPSGRRNKRKK